MTAAIPERDVLVGIYRRMTRIKQNDERFRAVLKSGKLVMPYYSPRGQEVIPSAVSACLTDEDYICTIYRGVHDMIAKGIPLKDLWAEFGGRVTGTCKGKGGPMHVTHPATGVMVTTGIVGSSMPIANGLALAAQIRGEKRVSVAYFGDGASNIGAFHEALNMASVWKLPVIFVCQNNGYAEHTKYAYGTSVPNIAQRAVAYSMPGVTVDGNDPVAMYHIASEAVDRARAGQGPTLIEAKTFRFHGHVFGDADAYMDKGEKDAWVAKDPVPLFRTWLIATGNATEEQLAALEADIESEIDEALEFTLNSPYPDVAELKRDIFKDEVSV
ncbi:thiamine pyrophosphate-dependent dehydrogenase E1 component subunit alpha [Pseudomonas citronellolis]|uniref:thiamine pyrophosphate-dependent dehydrogenase E1 component subunit alpha n=1 Tax=Pseudomonas citronellolis TaxID=53408 RepID=UPI0021C06D20|nr:thiamine pyrophosphate-dependent dehydrogenase E1 component subunit alpha [Pseudomonas citronellolis]UXJ50198.1 thiamine pyrophosphate-dependent dehydrogenase E1 component subunit alpha [Pseudomonas citronellolis]